MTLPGQSNLRRRHSGVDLMMSSTKLELVRADEDALTQAIIALASAFASQSRLSAFPKASHNFRATRQVPSRELDYSLFTRG